MTPMVGQDGDVMGLFQLFNYKYGSLTLNTIKKMKAISKFLGGCTSGVILNAENMLVKIGLNSHMEGINQAVSQQWDLQNNSILMPQV